LRQWSALAIGVSGEHGCAGFWQAIGLEAWRIAVKDYEMPDEPCRVLTATFLLRPFHVGRADLRCDSLREREGFEPSVPQGFLWAEFVPSLAHYSARRKASVLERNLFA
jgi:hypothetical protein